MFTPLLVTSCYSFHFGTATPGNLVDRAGKYGYTALAQTDRNGVYGLPAFEEACAGAGLRPIFGMELTYEKSRVLLWARTRKGLSRIFRLITCRAEETFEPRRAVLETLDGNAGILAPGSCPDLLIAADDPEFLADVRGRVYALWAPYARGGWKKLLSLGAPPLATGEVRFLIQGRQEASASSRCDRERPDGSRNQRRGALKA